MEPLAADSERDPRLTLHHWYQKLSSLNIDPKSRDKITETASVGVSITRDVVVETTRDLEQMRLMLVQANPRTEYLVVGASAWGLMQQLKTGFVSDGETNAALGYVGTFWHMKVMTDALRSPSSRAIPTDHVALFDAESNLLRLVVFRD